MHALILALLLTGSGTGASRSPGVRRVPGNIGAYFSGAPVDSARATLIAPQAGRVTKLHAERTSTGTQLGSSSLTLSLLADGVVLCSLVMPCVGTGDSSADCDAEFSAGQDLHLVITESSCLTMPTFAAGAVWLW